MRKINKIMLGLFLGTSLVGSTIALSATMSSCSKELPKIAVTELLDNSPIEDYFQNRYSSPSFNDWKNKTTILEKLYSRVYEPYEILALGQGSRNEESQKYTKYFDRVEITKQDWETDENLKKIKYIKSISRLEKIERLYIPEHIEVIGEDILEAEDNWHRPPIEINKLPDNLLYLGSNAFKYKQLTLPKTLRYIGKNAFARTHMIEDFKDMSSLTKLRYIGQNAFGNLQDDSYIQFDKLVFPDSLEVINDTYSWAIEDYNVKFPTELEKVNYFYGKNTIFLKATEVVMPRNLKYFSGTSFNLTQVQNLDFTKVKQENFKTLFPVKDPRVTFPDKNIYNPKRVFQYYKLFSSKQVALKYLKNSIINMNIITKGIKSNFLDIYTSPDAKKFLEQTQGQMTLKLPGFMEKRFTNNYIKDTDKIFKTNNIKFEFSS